VWRGQPQQKGRHGLRCRLTVSEPGRLEVKQEAKNRGENKKEKLILLGKKERQEKHHCTHSFDHSLCFLYEGMNFEFLYSP
jgi:hypothetical protein